MSRILAIGVATILSGCALVGKQYEYKPFLTGEQPATLTTAAVEYSKNRTVLFSDDPEENIKVMLVSIDDAYITSGSTMFDDKPQAVQMTPARHVLALAVFANAASKTYKLNLDARAGENYTLMAAGVGEKPSLSFSGEETIPVSYRVWIADAAGNSVSALPELSVRRTVNGIPIN